MRIDDLGINIPWRYPTGPNGVTDKNGGAAQKPSHPAADLTDRVTISEEARALASQDSPPVGTVLPERLAVIRERVLSGAYDSLEMIDLLSRRILATGEV